MKKTNVNNGKRKEEGEGGEPFHQVLQIRSMIVAVS